MQVLKYIQRGDLIAIVAPAGKVQPERVLPAIHWLENRGYRVWQGEHLFGSYFQYSGTDEERTADLQSAFDNPEVKAIIFARGGYGTVRIVEKLNFDVFAKFPKWLAGFSDITILHTINNLLQLPSLHGAMVRDGVSSDGIPTPGFLAMIETLEGKQTRYKLEPNLLNKAGSVKAQITGGNLSLLYSLIGTPYDLDNKRQNFVYRGDRRISVPHRPDDDKPPARW
jgi:muramoyltetrapeptide carboxypeptidase